MSVDEKDRTDVTQAMVKVQLSVPGVGGLISVGYMSRDLLDVEPLLAIGLAIDGCRDQILESYKEGPPTT